MMSLLYASNVNAVNAAAAAAAASRSRIDDEINRTSFKVRKYVESKLAVIESGSKQSSSTDAAATTATTTTSVTDNKTEVGRLILDARKRESYARRLRQQQPSSSFTTTTTGQEQQEDARRLGHVVAQLRETTTAEYCALKERASALENQKQALEAELALCLQSLQVVGAAGTSIMDTDDWYESSVVPVLDGGRGNSPPTVVGSSSNKGSSSSFMMVQSRNDEDATRSTSWSRTSNSSVGNPFIETILMKEDEKRTLRCAEVMASLASKQQSKPTSIEGQWTEGEDAMIVKAVTESSAKPFTSWTALSEFLPGRTGKQIRERWFNSLDPNINKSPFSPEDDDLLWQSHRQYGKKWVEIAAKAFQGFRSANQVKNRWHSAKFKEVILSKYGEGAYVKVNEKSHHHSSNSNNESSDPTMTSRKRDHSPDESSGDDGQETPPELKRAKQ